MKLLIVLASYGHTNDRQLERTLAEYRSMPYQKEIVVLSNIPKELGPDVRVLVGLPEKNPFTLPFGHKKVLAEGLEQHDLFLYAEDDILITERNIEAFLRATELLPEDELAGFVHADTGTDGTLFYDPLHEHYHWDPASVCRRGDLTFAYFTNEHSACFLLTRKQLRRALDSGGFLVRAHEGRYQLRETAATDPYTQCGFRKMVCISQVDDFTVLHLTNNKFGERPYRHAAIFRRQIDALLNVQRNGRPRTLLFDVESKVPMTRWSKSYYEPVRTDMLALLPATARSILSIGCGWGATEGWLVEKGMRVVGIPLDAVIAGCLEDRGVEVVYGSFREAREKLARERFDCLLLSDVLHLLPDPVPVLKSFVELLSPNGCVITSTPNFLYLPWSLRRLVRHTDHRNLGNFSESGVQTSTPGKLRAWLRKCGLSVDKEVHVVPTRFQALDRSTFRLASRFLGSSLIVRSHGQGQPQPH